MDQLTITVRPDGTIENIEAARAHLMSSPTALANWAAFYRKAFAAMEAAEAKKETPSGTDH